MAQHGTSSPVLVLFFIVWFSTAGVGSQTGLLVKNINNQQRFTAETIIGEARLLDHGLIEVKGVSLDVNNNNKRIISWTDNSNCSQTNGYLKLIEKTDSIPLRTVYSVESDKSCTGGQICIDGEPTGLVIQPHKNNVDQQE